MAPPQLFKSGPRSPSAGSDGPSAVCRICACKNDLQGQDVRLIPARLINVRQFAWRTQEAWLTQSRRGQQDHDGDMWTTRPTSNCVV